MSHPIAFAVLAAAAILALAFAGGIIAFVMNLVGGDPATAVGAGAAVTTAVATSILMAGSFVAAWYVRQQVAEERRSREAGLRPVVVMDEARSLDGLIYVRLRNVGPGPALRIYVSGWDRYDDAPDAFEGAMAEYSAFLDQEGNQIEISTVEVGGGLSVLGPGDDEEFPLLDPADPSATQSERQHAPPAGRRYYRITYKDAFGNSFPDLNEDERLPMRPFQARMTSPESISIKW